jgi:hypothetical protein
MSRIAIARSLYKEEMSLEELCKVLEAANIPYELTTRRRTISDAFGSIVRIRKAIMIKNEAGTQADSLAIFEEVQ